MDRFIRTEALVGKEGLARLQAAYVAVVGLGGVGGAALEVLVAMALVELAVAALAVAEMVLVELAAMVLE